MNAEETYEQLWKEACPLIQKNTIQLDRHLHTLAEDKRIGITLCCRPDKEIRKNILSFLKSSAEQESSQYYYPEPSLHTTVLSIITTGTDFELDGLDINAYHRLIEEALVNIPHFSIEYKGVTASSGAVMIQGFPTSDTLESIRQSLRKAFKNSSLLSTIDARYVLHTAHITCLRFKEKLENPDCYAQFLNQWREEFFGVSKVSELELVANDWYMRPEKTRIIAKVPLK
jgi:2'-5' RNA ligase